MTASTTIENVLVMTRRFAAKRELVFTAISSAEHLKNWMCPAGFTVPSATAELRIGGRFRVEMLSPEGELFVVGGVYRVIEPPGRLAFTWIWETEHTMPGIETTVTIQLAAQGDETVLTMTHTGLPNEAERASHENGWTGA
ncbi:MAG: SRPBCC domain-containing protein, partial [Candidatus Obscuribacterales bacterium]|nr:SRPBCC domain-containing protein [Steroidobacteraceae bacterium]